MSSETTVEVSQHPDGGYTAVEPETGATGEGETPAEALASLAQVLAVLDSAAHIADAATTVEDATAFQKVVFEELLSVQTAGIESLISATKDSVKGITVPQKGDQDSVEDLSSAAMFVDLTQGVQKRFEDENVDDDDIEDAIEWARSR